jgi:hypothetical protein
MRIICGRIPELEAYLEQTRPYVLHGYSVVGSDINRAWPGYAGEWPEYLIGIPDNQAHSLLVCFRRAPKLPEFDNFEPISDAGWALLQDPRGAAGLAAIGEPASPYVMVVHADTLSPNAWEHIADSGPLPRDVRRRLLITAYQRRAYCTYLRAKRPATLATLETLEVHLEI